MASLLSEIDRSKKNPGDIGTCLWHIYSGIEVEVVERFDPIEYEGLVNDSFEPSEQIWIRRTDGLPFESNAGSPIRRNNNKEELLNEGWVKATHRDWDTEVNR